MNAYGITAKNLLAITDYTVAKAEPKTRVNGLDKHIERLTTEAPEFAGQNIEGYKIIGKTSVFQQYIAEQEGNKFAINIKRIVGATAAAAGKVKKPIKDLSTMNLKTKRLRDVHFDESLFIPMKSNSAIDYCYSQEGGIMPGTNYIFIGDPGVGKSSITIEHAVRVQKTNPDKKVLFISAEMTELDMIPYTKRFPLWLDIDTLFVSDLTEGLYK